MSVDEFEGDEGRGHITGNVARSRSTMPGSPLTAGIWVDLRRP